jgi:hypothetical protein
MKNDIIQNNKILTKTPPKDFSMSILEFMKLGIFGKYTKNNKDVLINENINMFNCDVKIVGMSLNGRIDYPLFLYLIKQNKKNFIINIKDVLYDLNICNNNIRMNKEKRLRIINSLQKLRGTVFHFNHLEDEKYTSMNLVKDYKVNGDEIYIELNENLESLYQNTKFKKYLHLDDFIGLSDYDSVLLNYILTLPKKYCVVKLETLKKVFTTEDMSNKNYNRALKTSLDRLQTKKFIGDWIPSGDSVEIHKNPNGIKSEYLFRKYKEELKKKYTIKNISKSDVCINDKQSIHNKILDKLNDKKNTVALEDEINKYLDKYDNIGLEKVDQGYIFKLINL